MATDEYVRTLEERVRVAERVCVLVGINASSRVTERGKALTQAWMIWSQAYGGRAVPVTDEEVHQLAEIRDTKIALTLKAIERDYPEIKALRRDQS
jgi:hypothetical protein